jgi:RHS repeat-associated protein
LGNVYLTLSGLKLGYDTTSDGRSDYYGAAIRSALDYYAFGMSISARTYNSSDYRYGFNGKEDDDETQTQDYGFRTYNPRLGRFFSVDPLTKDYPYLTPYQFASNSPISGIDLDGLEYYYAADGKLLGQGGDPDNKEVRLGKITGKTKSGNNIITAVALKGQTQSQWTVIHNNHDDFKAMAGVLYAEADGTTSEAVDEVAAIYSVLENRSNYEGTTVKEQMTVAKGVFGANATEANKINQAAKVGMKAKKEAVFSGLIKGILSETDFSNGAFYWDGKDFNKDAKPNGGYKERYVPGFQFTDMSHDLFNQGDNLVKGSNTFKMGGKKTITKSWDYKYQSTGAIGKTTFSTLTDSWRGAQHPSKQAKKVGNGQE